MKKIHLNETESNLILSPLSAKLANELVFTIGEITSNQVLSNSRGLDVWFLACRGQIYTSCLFEFVYFFCMETTSRPPAAFFANTLQTKSMSLNQMNHSLWTVSS